MKKSQQAGSSRNQENVKIIVKCPCDNYIRRNNRPALANIQVETSRKQYSTPNNGQKATVVQSKQTKTSNNSHHLQPPAAPIRRSNSCSCTSSRSSTSETLKSEPSSIAGDRRNHYTFEDNQDDVFLLPSKTTVQSTIRSASQSRVSSSSTQQDSQVQLKQTQTSKNFHHLHPSEAPSRRSNSCSCTGSRSSSSESLKTEPSSIISNRRNHYNYKDKQDDVALLPAKTTTIRSASQSRVSSSSTKHDSQLLPNLIKKQSTIRGASLGKVSPISNKQTVTKIDPTSNIEIDDIHLHRNITKRSSSSSTEQSIASKSNAYVYKSQITGQATKNLVSAGSSACKNPQELNSFRPKRGCCSSTSATLPNQQFVTLTQDTLISTTCSISPKLDPEMFLKGNVRLIRATSFVDEDDRPLVDGKQFFSGLGPAKCSTIKTKPIHSPCSTNLPPRRSSNISETLDENSISKPAVKSTLRRRSSIKTQIVFPLLYTPEYRADIISYCFDHKNNLILKSDWVKTYIDKRARTNTINWLINISLFMVPHCEPVYYMSVRLFDYSIKKLRLRNGHYQLAAIVAFWISIKYLDSYVLKVPKIFSLCNGKYSKEQILSMERNILKSVNFTLNIPDPLDFLYNYLRCANVENDQLLKYGAKFILECASLFQIYSMLEAPLLAANALYMAYRILRSPDVDINFIWFSKNSIDYYVRNILTVYVKSAIAEKYEPVKKYLTSEKLYVARKFFDM